MSERTRADSIFEAIIGTFCTIIGVITITMIVRGCWWLATRGDCIARANITDTISFCSAWESDLENKP